MSSVVLYTELKSIPRVRDLVDRLGIPMATDDGIPLLVSPQWTGDDQLFDDGARFLFYIPYESTRAIEVWREGNSFCVCIMPFSSEAEIELSIRFLEACRDFGAQQVFSNNGDRAPLSFDHLRQKYSTEFSSMWSNKALQELIATVDGKSDVIMLEGPIREFSFGPHLASVLVKIPDESLRLSRLLEMMKSVQFWTVREDFDGFAEPDISNNLLGKQIATIRPNSRYVVPNKIDELHFEHGERIQKVAVREFIQKWTKGLPVEKFQLLDECHFKLSLNSSDLQKLIESNITDLDTPVTELGSVSEVVDRLARKARREAFTGERFGQMVSKAEKLYDYDPKVYKIVVGVFAAAGFGYVLFFLWLAFWGVTTWAPSVLDSRGINFIPLVLTALFGSLGLLILRALFVSFPSPNGIKLERGDAPNFFKMLDSVQSKLNVHIDEVLINHDHNAFITQVPRLGMLGFHKNYLVVGIPLLYSLTVDRAVSVLAHEIGHISGQHGKFGSWIYGLTESWNTLIVELGKRSQIGLIAFFPFYCWYFPRFRAYAQVLNREQEHEADQMATLITNRMANAESLIAVHLQAKYLQHKFWKNLSKRTLMEPHPPDDLLLDMAQQLQHPRITEQEAQEWYRQCLLTEGDPHDTHPSLGERLLDIGYPARERTQLLETPMDLLSLLTIKDNAAKEFLGARAELIAKTLSKFWQEGARFQWEIEHKVGQILRKRLEELESKVAASQMVEDDWLEFGNLIERFQGSKEAIPAYKKHLEINPRDGKAFYLLGRALLEENDETGISYLEQAMSKDARYISNGCVLAIDYYKRHKKEDIVKQYQKRLADHKASAILAFEERERISENEEFAPHDLKAALVQEIIAHLKSNDRIQSAYLAKRRLKHLPGISHYVLGVERQFSMSFNQTETLGFLSMLQDSLADLDEHISVVDLSEFNKNLRPKFATVIGSQIYTK